MNSSERSPRDAPRAARTHENVSAVILAGGRASRMAGADKAFLKIGGKTIFERIHEVLAPRFDNIVVVTHSPERYPASVRTTRDRIPDCGPLGGLHAGLLEARHEYALVVAGDMPALSPGLIDFLVETISGEDAVVPRWDGRLQTLHAVYARRLAGPLESALLSGTRAVHEFLATVRVRILEPALIEEIPGACASFFNINSGEDLESAPVRDKDRPPKA
jgi:molybdopterin-guanine dinucleotide biosynthesis protein A